MANRRTGRPYIAKKRVLPSLPLEKSVRIFNGLEGTSLGFSADAQRRADELGRHARAVYLEPPASFAKP
jgi:hypothetical protein